MVYKNIDELLIEKENDDMSELKEYSWLTDEKLNEIIRKQDMSHYAKNLFGVKGVENDLDLDILQTMISLKLVKKVKTFALIVPSQDSDGDIVKFYDENGYGYMYCNMNKIYREFGDWRTDMYEYTKFYLKYYES